MRIIDYYNYIATAAYIIFGVAAVIICKKKNGKDISDRAAYIAFGVIMLVAAFLRLFMLGQIPYGLQQDEASIGYDAYTLATYGIDRNGYPYPIYPITWGCGGGSPLLIYLNVIVIKLFGTGVIKLRMIPAVLGVATVFIFFFVLREIYGYESRKSYRNIIAVIGTLFLAICPWHVILSRWSLDSNIIPFFLCLALYLFMLGIRTGKTWIYILSAVTYAICMYSYGSATIVVPIHLLLLCIICLKKKVLNIKQLILSGITFMVVFAPLFLFYAVNYLGVPEILTDYFSVNKFTASRSGEVFLALDSNLISNLVKNFKALLVVLTFGDDAEMRCHYILGYATLFEFTFPITFIGIVASIVNFFRRGDDENTAKEKAADFVWISALIACFIMAIVIISDISRMAMMFLPLIYFFVRGCYFILEKSRKMFAAVVVIFMLAAASFTKDYFMDFNEITDNIFMPGYGDAISRAYEIAGDERQIYSTYEGLASPFMLALYYNNYDVYKFCDTVVYIDPHAEFRTARSFGNFVFDDLPDDIHAKEYENTVFVISNSELGLFEGYDGYIVEKMSAYSVVYLDNNGYESAIKIRMKT